jgi:hypothetical protein
MTAETEPSHPDVEIIPLPDASSGDFLSWHMSASEGVLKRHSGDGVLWQRTVMPGYSQHPKFGFGLKGLYDKYAVLCRIQESHFVDVDNHPNTILELCDMATGDIVLTVDVSKELGKIISVEISHGRLAIQGWRQVPR